MTPSIPAASGPAASTPAASIPAASIPAASIPGLAAPALVVLAAEPLYLLVDTAVVGHLDKVALGGLAVGGGLLAYVAALLNFLAYGTTARAARRAGAGDRAGAVTEGVQATWLALALGAGSVGVLQLTAGPLTQALAGGAGPVAAAAEQWLRVASPGLPLLLVALAGNGWLRGVAELRRPMGYVLAGNGLGVVLCPVLVHPVGMGLVGSAVANLAGQAVASALFARALVRELAGSGISWRPQLPALRAHLVLGRDLLLRAAVLQLAFAAAAAVVARSGTAELGAHQIALQLWLFLALVLDAYAIAAQTLVGQALGAGRTADARGTAARVVRWGLGTGVVVAVGLLALRPVLPPLFTDDPTVLAQADVVWWFLALMQPLAGVVFALDGVLMGAGDVALLRTATLAAALVGFVPLSLLSGWLGWGLPGVWTGLTLFIALRLVAVLSRVRGSRWLGETVRP